MVNLNISFDNICQYIDKEDKIKIAKKTMSEEAIYLLLFLFFSFFPSDDGV